MTYKEALSVLKLDTIVGIDKRNLSKRYKKLARYWHPDLNHSPEASIMSPMINEAYSVLSDALKELQRLDKNTNTKMQTIIITLDQLIEMYETGSTMNGRITSAEMIRGRSFVSIDGEIIHNNISRRVHSIVPFRSDNDYTINCVIDVLDMKEPETTRIRILNKDVKFDIKHISVIMRLSFADRIYVNVEISKNLVGADTRV